MHDPALIDAAQLVGIHLQKVRVVRQEVAGHGLKQGEAAGQHETKPRQRDQRAAVADQSLKKSA